MKPAHATPMFAALLMTLMLVVLTTAAHIGDTDGGFDLSLHTIDGGGGTSIGNSFQLAGTIGQPDASTVAMTGGAFELSGGFWPAADPLPAPTCPADIAPAGGDGLVNVNDLLAVINTWGPCPTPPAPCATDINNDGAVNVNDLLAVINAWGVCP